MGPGAPLTPHNHRYFSTGAADTLWTHVLCIKYQTELEKETDLAIGVMRQMQQQASFNLLRCQVRFKVITLLSLFDWMSHQCLSQSYPHTYSGTLTLHKLLVQITTKKTQLSPNTMVCGLCSVLRRGWESLGILGWAPVPEVQSPVWASFHEQRVPICMYFLLYMELWGCTVTWRTWTQIVTFLRAHVC